MSLQILYRDEHLIAINKPAGLLVHRSWLDKGETQFAMQMTRDLIGQHVYTVHRLDRPTSGILLFALDPETARHLTDAFASHRMQKEYLALVRGWAPLQQFLDYHHLGVILNAFEGAFKTNRGSILGINQISVAGWPGTKTRILKRIFNP